MIEIHLTQGDMLKVNDKLYRVTEVATDDRITLEVIGVTPRQVAAHLEANVPAGETPWQRFWCEEARRIQDEMGGVFSTMRIDTQTPGVEVVCYHWESPSPQRPEPPLTRPEGF